MPIGLVLLPLARRVLAESRGPAPQLDLGGLALGAIGLLGVTFGIVRGNPAGWGSLQVVGALAVGAAALAGFVAYEARVARHPMLPMRFFASRGFAATNGVSLIMFFGMFGSIFFLTQVFQTAQGYSRARVRAAHAAVDGDADLRGADRRASSATASARGR